MYVCVRVGGVYCRMSRLSWYPTILLSAAPRSVIGCRRGGNCCRVAPLSGSRGLATSGQLSRWAKRLDLVIIMNISFAAFAVLFFFSLFFFKGCPPRDERFPFGTIQPFSRHIPAALTTTLRSPDDRSLTFKKTKTKKTLPPVLCLVGRRKGDGMWRSVSQTALVTLVKHRCFASWLLAVLLLELTGCIFLGRGGWMSCLVAESPVLEWVFHWYNGTVG